VQVDALKKRIDELEAVVADIQAKPAARKTPAKKPSAKKPAKKPR
jgi:hypothetical protein